MALEYRAVQPVRAEPARPSESSRARQTLAMDHGDHVGLLRGGVLGTGKTWADLGSGEGAFTLALADLLGPAGSIHTVDRDGRALQVQLQALRDAFPGVLVTPLVADFTKPLELPPLDGVVMANSLHFVRDKLAVLRLVGGYLRANGRLILVEYDSDHGNRWVPFPLSFSTWAKMAAEAGFRDTQRLASIPSRFLGSIYSAVSYR
jgi:ubiquinone/menaquinone biosynthesis C-methylase UbiE